MVVGTVRAEETAVHDTYAGYHSFHSGDVLPTEDRETYGSFEVFHEDSGWYWHSCYPGCLPDGDVSGPYATSFDALKDADEFNPAIDWYFDMEDDS